MNPLDRSRIRSLVPVIVALAVFPRVLLAAPDLALEMTVANPVPAAGQPAEFTVTLRNLGADAAPGVQVADRLPPELRIPTGLAAFVSVGSYDPASGTWAVGAMDPGASATLVIPAVVAAPSPPPCVVNVAQADHALDTNRANNRASAAVRRTAADRCVDLSVAGLGVAYDSCGSSRRIGFPVQVANLGPDAASDLLVDLVQQPAGTPNLRFIGSTCLGTRCTIATLAAGSSTFLQVTSDSFDNQKAQTFRLGLSVSSSDIDYATANNQSSESVTIPRLKQCDYGIGKGVAPGCFIATAAYGSALEPHVVALREFRDRQLARSGVGRAFIGFYYRHSPPLAALISRHESLRLATRAALAPVVFAVERPREALALLALALGGLGAWRVRNRRGGGGQRSR